MLKIGIKLKEVVQSRLPSYVKIDESTYVNVTTVCRFIDEKYGEFWHKPTEIIQRQVGHKQRQIDDKSSKMLARYGVTNPSKNRDLAIKAAKSMCHSQTKLHWKTGEEVICVGSYESTVVDYLNSNQINFEWQPKVFKMPSGKTYRPDLYLSDRDLWIEIKGFFRGDALEKWTWFSENNRAELWDKSTLKMMGIL
jgi:hypothetical protein